MRDNPSSPPGQPAGKTWQAGTLTYTAAGLVVLFAWLLVGDFAWQLKERSVGTTAQLILKKFGAADLLVHRRFISLGGRAPQLCGPALKMFQTHSFHQIEE